MFLALKKSCEPGDFNRMYPQF